MIQQKTLDRLVLQNLINTYAFETQQGRVIDIEQQDAQQKQLSQGKPILEFTLEPLNVTMAVTLDKVSKLGQHRLADTPFILQEESWKKLTPVSVAALIIEDLACRQNKDATQNGIILDSNGVMKRWIESYEGLKTILEHRSDEMDDIIEQDLNFIETEQNLIYGHAMHPTPKGRAGFYDKQWAQYSPETKSQTQLHYWLVDPKYIAEDFVDGDSISTTLKEKLIENSGDTNISNYQNALLKQYPNYKLLPLHPWQAKFLQQQDWYQRLLEHGELFDIGEMGWYLHPTTSVRTLASFKAPWMFKVSLSVAITNSVRINSPKECYRGMYACRIWRSDYGKQLKTQYPTVEVLNDPAWIALTIDGSIVDETICILRDNPFDAKSSITNLASLSQDHPMRLTNRFATLFEAIHKRTSEPLPQIARQWFDTYLKVGFVPLIQMYYQHGFGFEVHQQNSLIELKDGYPTKFWARDNQGFGYIAEYATALIDANPQLINEAECVIPEDFADSRVTYYLVGNSIFGLITAIARTGLVSEDLLLEQFKQCLQTLEQQFPHRSLFDLLLRSPTLPFKGNLLTRLYALDELTAPVETQSIYVDIPNPLMAG